MVKIYLSNQDFVRKIDIFLFFSKKTYVVGTH